MGNSLNRPLFEAVARAIHNHPDHFDMDSFVNVGPCGTTACIAGWALSLSMPTAGTRPLENLRGRFRDPASPGVEATAAVLLGLTGDQRDKLFYVGEWPLTFRHAYESRRTEAGRAAVAARRVRHFAKHQR